MNLPKGRKAIKNYWVFNIKSDGYYRSWLVAKKFSQIDRIDFDELFSPVVCYKTVHLFLAVVALEDWNIHSVDVKTAYLYGDLDKKIYIEQPKGFRLPDKKKKVSWLYKTLYSLKQAGLSWWWTMTKLMLTLGFKQYKYDADVHYFIDKKTKELVIAIVYVDDICFMSSKDSLLLLELKQKFITK